MLRACELYVPNDTFYRFNVCLLAISCARCVVGCQDLVLAVIGELFEEPNVVGIGMAIRSREDLLSVWNEDNSNEKARSIH